MFIYNTLRGSLIQVDAQELPILEHITDELINNGFIISSEFNELEFLKEKREKAIYNKDAFYIRIMTTSLCNARCYYCYEKGVKRETMNKVTAIDIAKFICSISSETKFLNICWFGGEPLINTDVITLIIDYVKNNHSNKNLKIVSSFITNGSLIDSNIINHMKKDWFTRDVQVSMDGYGNDYNNIKNYVDNSINFNKVVENIKALVKTQIMVRVRLNIDHTNLEQSKKLIDFFSKEIGTEKNFKIYPGFLFDGNNIINDTTIKYDDSLIKESFADYLNNHSYSCTLMMKRKNLGCYAGRKDNFLVTPSGYIYKCAQHYADKNAKPLGNIYNIQNIKQKEWIDDDIPIKCLDCICLPLCQGGCKAARHTLLNLQECHMTINDLQYGVIQEIRKLYKKGNLI